ncbi:MAG: insulinase family protein [Raoultibacter sp.]
MQLTQNSTLHGFTVISKQSLPEIEGIAYTLHHHVSGARLLYLANDDANKAFAIGFKTPPQDSTGVFHILEHSVLCGSDRFPVKEPFVNLLKSSMQTFLNAMTFPDKTLYPVASTNEQDLLNLMDVYMDAVLHPAIYHKRAIFEQEGWHYELESPEEPLRYNGVVFNEMKGALSDPESVLYDVLAENLFPDTTYAFESGGHPHDIPTLTYEDFLDAHRRHYRLDNSYIILYGDMQVERELAFLDERYLSCPQQAAGSPNPLNLQKPVKRTGIVKTMQTAPENACTGLACVIGTSSDRERILDVDILMDALMGSNESPLKRALLDSKIGADASGQLIDSLLQPLVLIQVKGCQKDASAAFYDIVRTTVANLCAQGIDRKLLEASIARAEFSLREGDFGAADGVILAMECLSGWLYDDEQPTSHLRYEEAFAHMHEKIETGYFEDLLREIILENDHLALAEILPVDNDDSADEVGRLADIKAALNDEQLRQVIDETNTLHRLQEEPDTAANLATLPTLQLSDIAPAMPEETCTFSDDTPLPCLYHDIPTKRIDYTYHYFTLDTLTFDELPYATILARLLGKLDTTAHTAAQLDNLIQSRLGTLRFFTELHESEFDQHTFSLKFVVGASALTENILDLVSLPHEVWSSTLFDDTSKIKDVLQQQRIAMEQEFALGGHSTALARVASYYTPAAVVREKLSGVDFYRFLKDLLAHFDERAEALIGRLRSVSERIFTRDGTTVSFTGSFDDYTRFWDLAAPISAHQSSHKCQLIVPEPVMRNEAFIVPTDICFAAKGFDRRLLDIAYQGSWNVAGRALSYDYLWNEVRVKGGAYGAGFRATRTGALQFYSYRDPNLDATLARFNAAGEWLASFEPDEDALRGYIVSTVAGIDAPKKPREIARRQDVAHFSHFEPNYRTIARNEVLTTTKDTLHGLAPILDNVAARQATCVFGNRESIEASKAGLAIIDLLA